jgi:hypothetical protein
MSVFQYLWFHVCVSVSVVLGIPTVKREVQSYLLATLQNLIDSMNEEEAADSLIVIFIAEVPNFELKSLNLQ